MRFLNRLLFKLKVWLAKIFVGKSIKDRNYLTGVSIGLFVAAVVLIAYNSNVLTSLETYLQAWIFQAGYNLPKTTDQVTVVKKDQATSSLINKDPGRKEYASVFNLLGSSQTRDRMYKSRAQKYELFRFEIGYFENIRNTLPIATSYDEWAGLVVPDNSQDLSKDSFPDQDKWKGASRIVTEYFKKPENVDKAGYTSLIKVSGKTWAPKGKNLFKVLAGGNDYLVIPTLFTDWNDKKVINEIESSIALDEEVDPTKFSKDENKKTQQPPAVIIERWYNFFENLVFSDICYDMKLLPKKKKGDSGSDSDRVLFSFTITVQTNAVDKSYVVNPASVIGFDFVLQGDKDPENDRLITEALKKTNSRVILAAHRKTEEIISENAVDEAAFSAALASTTQKDKSDTSLDQQKLLDQQMSVRKYEDIMIVPSEHFLENTDNVDYAMIDMSVGNKAYITEVPIIVKGSEKRTVNGRTFTIPVLKPSFALRIALEKLDYDFKQNTRTALSNNLKQWDLWQKMLLDTETSDKEREDLIEKIAILEKTIAEQKKALNEPGYVESMNAYLKEIKENFIKGTFDGNFKVKDITIPLNSFGRMRLDFVGSTQKGKLNKAAIDSVSLYECLEEDLLKDYLKKNPTNEKLNPIFAHRRVLGGKNKNKGGKIFIVGPFESTDFDFYPTPLSAETPHQICKDPLMGIEIHANAILNILNKRYLKHPKYWHIFISVLFASILAGLLLEMFSPFMGAIFTCLFIICSYYISYFSYHSLRQVFYFSPLLCSIVLVWLLSTLVNYIKQRVKARTTKEMFSKFVSADVVQYMLDNPDLVRPGGTKTELTIFFSDVAGFTTISEGLSPEDLVVLLNEYLGAMTDLLFEYGGTLDKFIGDAVMAFWNFPKKQEDHAVRAVLCAIAMQKKIKELQIDWARRGFPKVAARCGINTQDVVVGYMGSQKAQMNFTCMGDGVNLASRLEGANKEYGTMMMVSDNTYQRVKHAVRGRFLDFLAVKGKKEPVKVHELVCKIGEEPEGWFERTELYDKAIQLHLERKWDEAIATFEEVLKLDPDDGPSKTYIARCNEYKVNPPPEGWDGRYILTHK